METLLWILLFIGAFMFEVSLYAGVVCVFCWGLNASGVDVHFSWQLVVAFFLFGTLVRVLASKNEEKSKDEEK